jgi:ABC-type glycerol-3-phosphate transport system substrate-binding protein
MVFPPGRPVLVLLVAAVGAAALLAWDARRLNPRPNLILWTFDASHAAIYTQPTDTHESLLDRYWRQTGSQVEVKLIHSRALDARLLSLFQAGHAGGELPDLIEIEIGSFGRYLRPEPSLLPLDDLLRTSSLATRLVPARLQTYTMGVSVLAIPFDLHPVALVYRKDLFDEAGVRLADCETWREFHAACLRFQDYWADAGAAGRRAMELSRYNASELSMLLLQQHHNLIDAAGRPQLAHETVTRTLAFYAGMVAGPAAITGGAASGGNLWVREFAEGRICALLMPDWRLAALRRLAPQLEGKLAVMPLPRFSPGDAPTATWGGTALTIPRHARDPAQSWQLLEYLLGSDDALRARRVHSDILPPLRHPLPPAILSAPDPYFGNQQVQRLYHELGQQVPARTVHPYLPMATQALARTLEQVTTRIEQQGPADLESSCEAALLLAQESLERLIAFERGGK